MRMTASWSGRYGPTEYKVVARYFAPDGKLPLGLLCCPTKKITGARSKSALTENCSAFTRVAACTLALPPIRDTLIEGFSHFVTSMTAPIASGRSGCRVGLAPTGKRRLVTAHTQSGRSDTEVTCLLGSYDRSSSNSNAVALRSARLSAADSVMS